MRGIDATDPFGGHEIHDTKDDDYSWNDAPPFERDPRLAFPPRPCTRSTRCTRADLHMNPCEFDATPLELSPRYDPKTGEVQ